MYEHVALNFTQAYPPYKLQMDERLYLILCLELQKPHHFYTMEACLVPQHAMWDI
jgi:hypothetical protein